MSFFKDFLESLTATALSQQENTQQFRNANSNAIAEMEKQLQLLREQARDNTIDSNYLKELKKQIQELEQSLRELRSFGI
ncbi:MAG: hypothetical protein EHM58_05205 [Ignavibacteriae bacterium]|nr:MAG: hypothetical protein EHM58_05205 [Ignavibacteriota bacterium]